MFPHELVTFSQGSKAILQKACKESINRQPLSPFERQLGEWVPGATLLSATGEPSAAAVNNLGLAVATASRATGGDRLTGIDASAARIVLKFDRPRDYDNKRSPMLSFEVPISTGTMLEILTGEHPLHKAYTHVDDGLQLALLTALSRVGTREK